MTDLKATLEIEIPPLVIVDYSFSDDLYVAANSEGLDPADFDIESGSVGYVFRIMVPAEVVGEGARLADVPGPVAYAVVAAGASTKGIKGTVKFAKKAIKENLGRDSAEQAEHRLDGDAAAMTVALAAFKSSAPEASTISSVTSGS